MQIELNLKEAIREYKDILNPEGRGPNTPELSQILTQRIMDLNNEMTDVIRTIGPQAQEIHAQIVMRAIVDALFGEGHQCLRCKDDDVETEECVNCQGTGWAKGKDRLRFELRQVVYLKNMYEQLSKLIRQSELQQGMGMDNGLIIPDGIVRPDSPEQN